MRIVLKEGIQSMVRKPEQEKLLGKLERITKWCFKEIGWENRIFLGL